LLTFFEKRSKLTYMKTKTPVKRLGVTLKGPLLTMFESESARPECPSMGATLATILIAEALHARAARRSADVAPDAQDTP
tara:strand:+ start:6512 stop:6751 length:240 start_codon:yes stop_codon:yes gene_type:complete